MILRNRNYILLSLIFFVLFNVFIEVFAENVVTKKGMRHFTTKDSGYITDEEFYRQVYVYTVKPGDNVYNIAKAFGLPVNYIIFANKLSKPYHLVKNQQLSIPALIIYVVKTGDTVTSISYKFGVSQEKLIKLNHLNLRLHLFPATKLIIPARPSTQHGQNLTLSEAVSLLQQQGGFTIANPPTKGKLKKQFPIQKQVVKPKLPSPVQTPSVKPKLPISMVKKNSPPFVPVLSPSSKVPKKSPNILQEQKPQSTPPKKPSNILQEQKPQSAAPKKPLNNFLSIPNVLPKSQSPVKTPPVSSAPSEIPLHKQPRSVILQKTPQATSPTNKQPSSISSPTLTKSQNNLFPIGGKIEQTYKNGYWITADKENQNVYVLESGLVVQIYYEKNLGNVVKLQVNHSTVFLYGNLQIITVKKGDIIKSKTIIGTVNKKLFLSYIKKGVSQSISILIQKRNP